MVCIICREEKNDKAFSKEHIFPDSIGGSVTLQSICKTCNSKFGSKVDIHLTDNFLIKQVRYKLKLAGKKGRLPEPFREGILTDDPDRKVIFDGYKPKLLPKVMRNEDVNNKASYSINCSSYKEAEEIMLKLLKRNGVKDVNSSNLERFITSQTSTQFQPEVTLSFETDVEGVAVAIAKIAYELAYYWLGDDYLDDETGIRISKMIMHYIENGYVNDSDKELLGMVKDDSKNKSLLVTFENMLRHKYKELGEELHSALLIHLDGQIQCIVKIFDISYFERNHIISKCSNKYKSLVPFYLIVVDPKNGKIFGEDILELAHLYSGSTGC